MATFGTTSFGGTTADERKKMFNVGTGTEDKDLDLGLGDFDITKSPLYQTTAQTATGFMSGETPEFDIQANIAREAQKASQAQRTRAQREALMQEGMRDTGTYVSEGLIKPAEEALAERSELERRLAADRETLAQQRRATGMQTAASLIGSQAQQQTAMAGIESSEKLGFASIESTETIAEMNNQSREKIAADQIWIQQQGIDLDTARLYGYTDEAGNHVAGSAEIAANYFGLDSAKVDMARDELYGYVDPVTGQRIQGKISLMNEADQREAARLYGYQDENTGQWVMGELQLAEDANSIARQGLELEEAQAFGYTDDDGEYHPGRLEMEYEALGLDKERFLADRLALFGGIDPETGQQVMGTLQIAAEELGLKGETLKLQTEELWGGYDANGNWVPGTLASMSAEQLLRADELYGYFDPNTGDWVPGQFEQSKQLLTLKGELETTLAREGIAFEMVMSQIENIEDPVEAAAALQGIADQYGVEMPDVSYATKGRAEAGARAFADYQNGKTLSDDAVQALIYSDNPNVIKDNTIEGTGVNEWVQGIGEKNHWSLSGAARDWANNNVNKVYIASNGRAYQVVGPRDKNERHFRAYIEFKDIQTGQLVRLDDKGGFVSTDQV